MAMGKKDVENAYLSEWRHCAECGRENIRLPNETETGRKPHQYICDKCRPNWTWKVRNIVDGMFE